MTVIWVAARQNQHNDMCAQQRLRSACASAQSDQSLRWAHEETLGLGYPMSAKWRDAHADLSLCLAQSFCWFYHDCDLMSYVDPLLSCDIINLPENWEAHYNRPKMSKLGWSKHSREYLWVVICSGANKWTEIRTQIKLRLYYPGLKIDVCGSDGFK